MNTIVSRILLFSSLLLLFSCRSVGPKSVVRDRNAYLNAVSDSWKNQQLLNIVKMRYADAPVFLDVSSITNQYEISGAVSAGIALEQKGVGWNPSINGTGTFTDRPTITYSPLSGQKFAMNLMKPISPAIIISLVYSGYPIDLLFKLTLNSINGMKNSSGSNGKQQPASPGFHEILEAMRALQNENGMDFVLEKTGTADERILIQVVENSDSLLGAKVKRLNQILNLPPGNTRFRIGTGIHRSDSLQIALSTRSILALLGEIASTIDVPVEHLDARMTYATPCFEMQNGLPEKPFVNIHSTKTPPVNPFISVLYNNYWFYIAMDDFSSKQIFSHIMMLNSLVEVGDPKSAPIITIPTR
ncbi:MAG: hypothetical protein WCK09_13880 [Bacteroidota bacterium]